MTSPLAPAILISTVYDLCQRLEQYGVLRGMHPVWNTRDASGPYLREDRVLLGSIRTSHGERTLSVGLSAARGGARHEGRCPVCTLTGDEGPVHLALFDPGCTPMCPWHFPSRTTYVAHRMIPALGRASGENTSALYRVVGVRPPRAVLPPREVTSLADALFGS